MSDTLITIVIVIAILLLMFAVPMLATANQNDKITASSVKALAEEFVNKEANQGKITEDDYNAFIRELNATGNTYVVNMEVQRFGDNAGAKGSSGETSVKVIGENLRSSEFTFAILNTFKDEKPYLMNKGDYFIVTVKNDNITLGQELQTFFYQMVGKDTTTIDTSASSLVTVTGVK